LLTQAPYRLVWDASTAPSGPTTISAVAFDAGGNSGTSSATVTVDTTPPAVTGFSPANGATGVASDAVPSVTFNESVRPDTTSFQVRDAANHLIAGTVGYDDT